MPCLDGTTVICTGFPDQTRQLLQRLVVDLGGSYLTDCSIGAGPDVMVAHSVLSSKYKVLAAKAACVSLGKRVKSHQFCMAAGSSCSAAPRANCHSRLVACLSESRQQGVKPTCISTHTIASSFNPICRWFVRWRIQHEEYHTLWTF